MEILENFDYYYEKSLKVFYERSINVDTTHRCLLQCPFCSRQSEPSGKTFVKKSQVSYGDLKLSHAKDLGNTFNRIDFCGQISDPIYHSNFSDVFRQLISSSCQYISVHTTGSHKKIEFWKELYDLSASTQQNIEFVFGIDGIDQKSALHRVNQKSSDAFEAMFLGAEYAKKYSNMKIVWQYIPFLYNEKDLPAAREIALEKGIRFLLLKSGRFKKDNSGLEPPKNPDLFNFNSFSERIEIE